MNFEQVLHALEKGHMVRRPGCVILQLSNGVVPVFATGILSGVSRWGNTNNWLKLRFPIVARHLENDRMGLYSPGAPHEFGLAERQSDDWEIVS